MSGHHDASLHPATKDSIWLNEGRCGCEQRGSTWWLCSYHEGFDDGASAPMPVAERQRIADEVWRRVLNDSEPVFFAVATVLDEMNAAR